MKIAIFHHLYVGGGVIPASFDNCLRIAAEQLDALNCSGLIEHCDQAVVGISGPEAEYAAVAALVPDKAVAIHHQLGVGELPTMKLMQDWAKANPGWAVFYLHSKGAIHNGNPTYEAWRKCMEKYCLWAWRDCLKDLERGFDTVGAHWLTPGKYPFIGKVPYWGGNVFWARSDYLNTLPPVEVMADRYQAEVWIGKSTRRPNVRDYVKHFPMSGC